MSLSIVYSEVRQIKADNPGLKVTEVIFKFSDGTVKEFVAPEENNHKKQFPSYGSIETRFLARIEKENKGFETDCWLWQSHIDKDGYAKLNKGSYGTTRAHGWAYLNWVGPLAEGEVVDHLCRIRHCVNPEHLQAVSHGHNARLGFERKLQNRTVCPQGQHEWNEENTRIDLGGTRICVLCSSLHSKTAQDDYYVNRQKICLREGLNTVLCANGHEIQPEWKRCNVCHAERERNKRRAAGVPEQVKAKEGFCRNEHELSVVGQYWDKKRNRFTGCNECRRIISEKHRNKKN